MGRDALDLLRNGAFLPAVPLVLDEHRAFDEAGQRRLLRYYIAAGADGAAVAVHTTQFEIRDPKHDLLERVLHVSADELHRASARHGRAVIKVAGACGDTEQAIREARLAYALGYDAVLLSPGGLARLNDEYLLERTRRVASILPVIGFYLQTAVGGRYLPYTYWRELCAIPGVAAIKCAAFNRYATLDVMRAVADTGNRVALYTGNDDSIVADLLTPHCFVGEDGAQREARFTGGLLGHWAVWTSTAVRMFREARRMAAETAIPSEMLTLGYAVTDANAAFFDVAHQFRGCIAGIHEVLRRQGLMRGTWCLNPKETLSPGQAEEIDRVHRMYPALNDDAFVRDFLAHDDG